MARHSITPARSILVASLCCAIGGGCSQHSAMPLSVPQQSEPSLPTKSYATMFVERTRLGGIEGESPRDLWMTACGPFGFVVVQRDGRIDGFGSDAQPQWRSQNTWPKSAGIIVFPSSMSVSPDQIKVALSFSSDVGRIEIKSLKDGSTLREPLLRGEDGVQSCVFDPRQADVLWVATGRGNIEKWLVGDQTSKLLARVGRCDRQYGVRLLASAATSEVFLFEQGRVRSWRSGEVQPSREFHGGWITMYSSLAPSGERILSVEPPRPRGSGLVLDVPSRVTVWSVTSGRVETEFQGWTNGRTQAMPDIREAAFVAPNIVVMGDDKHTRLFDLAERRWIASIDSPIVGKLPAVCNGTVILSVRSDDSRYTPSVFSIELQSK